MGAATLAAEFRSLSRQPPVDPDVQATLSDFLTYTEHFPSHLTRALSLVEDQRIRAERSIRSIHEDALLWSQLPQLKAGRPDPVALRRNISYALQEAERASRMALEEATRIDESCAREAKRLDLVVAKLKAQPMPPSRDPTPEQPALSSPNLKRERRTSLRGDDARPEKGARRLDDRAATKLRGRKIMVPGEVLPPPDPNALIETESDWTSPRHSPPIEESPYADRERKTATPRQRSRTPKLPKLDKEKKLQKARVIRTAGQPGTNAHSAVAGISTSNALLALTAPPEGAQKGSKWLPWMALTEWEMAKLRKRMKKNAIWVPSQTMVRRELKVLGRGVAGREAAREEAEATGGVFVDEQAAPDPTKTLIEGELPAQAPAVLDDRLYEGGAVDDQDQELINRGMRLNEAKKLKRQRLLEEQALQAQFQREQDIDTDRKAPARPSDGRKRKREPTPTGDSFNGTGAVDAVDSTTRSAPKRLKISAPAGVVSSTSRVPLGPPGASSPRANGTRLRTTTPPATGRKASLLLKNNKAVSEEPPNRRASLRRGSNASLPNSSALTSPGGTVSKASTTAGRRTRRPAPGFLRSSDADSAKVGVSKRKAAPRRKTGAGAASRLSTSDAAVPEAVPEEDIDPDEPRYCLCGDVSWGTMIACDNDDCDKEWFHLACVGLEELPPRRTKWYCPDCRKKLKMGTGSNGLIGRTTSVGAR